MGRLLSRTITNFGGEVRFRPKELLQPATDGEVLSILEKHAGGKVRAIGSLHSWNKGMETPDALIDLGKMDKISVTDDGRGPIVEAGGGCTLQSLVDALSERGLAMPTLGAIKRQTIAGALSTATHGSGRRSISAYMEELRLAAYDAEGKPAVFTYREGDPALEAARCAVGCMGVVLSARFRALPEFWVEERGAFYGSIQEALAQEKAFPLQQMILIPYDWRYFSFRRRETEDHGNPLSRAFWKAYDYLVFEVGTHLMLKATLFLSSLLDSRKLIPAFYERIVPSFLSGRRYVNPSADALTLHTSHHYYFRHLEMELFIPEREMPRADSLIRAITSSFADASYEPDAQAVSSMKEAGVYERVLALRGTYQHHYPIFFRCLHEDPALISMSSGGKRYSASFFTYLAPEKRADYYRYAQVMAETLSNVCDARLHWGKYFPLDAQDTALHYPQLDSFRAVCRSVDPEGVFRNGFTEKALGL